MKMIIQTEADLRKLQGKFVLQISSDTPDKTLQEYPWGFVKEKRLILIAGLGYVDLYGVVRSFDSFEKFKNFFNEYLFDHMIKEGKTTGDRFHRLLTARELEYLLEKLKEENY